MIEKITHTQTHMVLLLIFVFFFCFEIWFFVVIIVRLSHLDVWLFEWHISINYIILISTIYRIIEICGDGSMIRSHYFVHIKFQWKPYFCAVWQWFGWRFCYRSLWVAWNVVCSTFASSWLERRKKHNIITNRTNIIGIFKNGRKKDPMVKYMNT